MASGEEDLREDGRRGRRTGRRPGNPDTRAHILEVALREFHREGYDGISVRGIARAAGVDPALVHRYFGDKKSLLLAAVNVPFDPETMIARIAAGGTQHIGVRLVHTVAGLWEEELGPSWVPFVRANPQVIPIMAGVLNPLIARAAQELYGVPPTEAQLRASLIETVMVGTVVTRYVAQLDGISALTRDDLARLLGPVVEQLILGELRLAGRHLPARKSPPRTSATPPVPG